MKRFIQYSLVAVGALVIAVGCGGSGDGGSGDENSTSQAEPTVPADAEFVYLKIEGMS
jgi:hypothetical protein